MRLQIEFAILKKTFQDNYALYSKYLYFGRKKFLGSKKANKLRIEISFSELICRFTVFETTNFNCNTLKTNELFNFIYIILNLDLNLTIFASLPVMYRRSVYPWCMCIPLFMFWLWCNALITRFNFIGDGMTILGCIVLSVWKINTDWYSKLFA